MTVSGVRYPLEEPFFVLATQNPIEMEGTYPLPEAQLDRFLFKILIVPPAPAALVEILTRTTAAEAPRAAKVLSHEEVLALQRAVREIVAPPTLLSYAARMVAATHPSGPGAPEAVRRFVRYGASPRAAQALVLGAKAEALLAGRPHASPEGIRRWLRPVLRHRLLLTFESQAEGVDAERVIAAVEEAVPPHDAAVARLLREA